MLPPVITRAIQSTERPHVEMDPEAVRVVREARARRRRPWRAAWRAVDVAVAVLGALALLAASLLAVTLGILLLLGDG
jgi:hypothetical protein